MANSFGMRQRPHSKYDKNNMMEMDGDMHAFPLFKGTSASKSSRCLVSFSPPHRLLNANDTFLSTFNFSDEQAIGRSLGLIGGPLTNAVTFSAAIKSARLGHTTTFTSALYSRSGQEVLMNVTATPYTSPQDNRADPDEPMSCMLTMQVSEAKSLKGARFSEDRPVAFISSCPPYAVKSVNSAFSELYGVSNESATGRTLRFIQGPRTDILRWGEMMRAAQGGFCHTTTLCTCNSECEEFPTEVSITPMFSEKEGITSVFVLEFDAKVLTLPEVIAKPVPDQDECYPVHDSTNYSFGKDLPSLDSLIQNVNSSTANIKSISAHKLPGAAPTVHIEASQPKLPSQLGQMGSPHSNMGASTQQAGASTAPSATKIGSIGSGTGTGFARGTASPSSHISAGSALASSAASPVSRVAASPSKHMASGAHAAMFSSACLPAATPDKTQSEPNLVGSNPGLPLQGVFTTAPPHIDFASLALRDKSPSVQVQGIASPREEPMSAIFPRRKQGSKDSVAPVVITLEVLESLGDTPLADASKYLGLSSTSIKKACRKLGVQRWPYRKNADIVRPGELLSQYNDAYVRKLYRKYCPKPAKTDKTASNAVQSPAAASTSNMQAPASRATSPPPSVTRISTAPSLRTSGPAKKEVPWSVDNALLNWPAQEGTDRGWSTDTSYCPSHPTLAESMSGCLSMSMDVEPTQEGCLQAGIPENSQWFVSNDVNG